jgi:beta-glucanase (GH16 family)
MRSVTTAMTALVLVGSSAVLGASAGAEPPVEAAGVGIAQEIDPEIDNAEWASLWKDDFTGPAGALPSASNWIIDLGHSYPGGPANWGTGEIQRYTDDSANLSLDGNGNLQITALRSASGEWTSARIETVRSSFKPGPDQVLAIESSLRLPQVSGEQALGYWPAFWALGSPYRGNYWNWPGIGEFDVMENVNGLDQVWGVLHCGVAPGGPCNEYNGIANSTACPGGACQQGFRTYRVEWDRSVQPEQLRWYIDGQQYHTVSAGDLPADTWSQMTDHEGYFVLLNLAMGGAFPNGVAGRDTPVAATQPGHSLVVDRVEVWLRDGDGDDDPPPSSRDARSTIQAEDYQDQFGAQAEDTSDAGGGENIGWIANGDWLRYDTIDFGAGPPNPFCARVASGAGGGVSGLVQVRIDDLGAPPIAEFAIASTGGWQSWQTVPANAQPVTGVHTVYLTFESGQPADYVNVNWFTFGASCP